MDFRAYASQDELSADLSRMLAEDVGHAVSRSGQATLVVPGGSSPKALLPAFAASELPWDRITLMASDERCVPADDPRRNEASIRQIFAAPLHRGARLLSFDSWRQAGQGDLAVQAMEGIGLPFAAVLLGMGEDGHFASLFPGSHALPAGLDPSGPLGLLRVRDAPDGLPRDSLSLSLLADCGRLYLLATGERKRAVLGEVEAGRAPGLPVATLAARMRPHDRICWAP